MTDINVQCCRCGFSARLLAKLNMQCQESLLAVPQQPDHNGDSGINMQLRQQNGKLCHQRNNNRTWSMYALVAIMMLSRVPSCQTARQSVFHVQADNMQVQDKDTITRVFTNAVLTVRCPSGYAKVNGICRAVEDDSNDVPIQPTHISPFAFLGVIPPQEEPTPQPLMVTPEPATTLSDEEFLRFLSGETTQATSPSSMTESTTLSDEDFFNLLLDEAPEVTTLNDEDFLNALCDYCDEIAVTTIRPTSTTGSPALSSGSTKETRESSEAKPGAPSEQSGGPSEERECSSAVVPLVWPVMSAVGPILVLLLALGAYALHRHRSKRVLVMV